MSDDIAAIEQEIAQFEAERSGVLARIKALSAEEDPLAGVFRHEEIHAAKQEKLRLDFEIQYRRARINRLRFGG
ncbi:hypothetical protein NNJEOMEG_01964 [Fundidesulfovibrio magnetotacticus]|uniref:Uncharacterized protein n=1 Tax=Fundidesulfovibrio magnetotacticus TaxID=2730080 RepID=A0A6V8M0Y6_9BACT|nr:hypothetical protein [Fundidesulfovibrio magnetotacticus]GFK94125.1 hypothetical protein NNJEOMEG_01964 [Fundidesulfovibrio magnetotacticus]